MTWSQSTHKPTLHMRVKGFLAFLCLIVLLPQLSARDFIVATNGKDSNAGTLASPLRTIQRGVDLAQPGDRVQVRAGVYYETVTFPRDGRSGQIIQLLGYGNERVILAGGDRVTGWTRHSGDVWVANCDWDYGDDGVGNTLFLDGKLAFEGRFPNSNNPIERKTWGLIKKLETNGKWLESDALKSAPGSLVGAKARFQFSGFRFSQRTVESFDRNIARITFDSPAGRADLFKSGSFYLYDKLSLVDQEGEWWKDRKNNRLYLHAGKGKNPNNRRVEFRRRGAVIEMGNRKHLLVGRLELHGAPFRTGPKSESIELTRLKCVGWDKARVNDVRPDLRGTFNTLRNSEIHQNWSAMRVDGQRNRIINCLFQDSGFRGDFWSCLAFRGEEHLVTRCSFVNFGCNVTAAFAPRMIFSYNLIRDGGNLGADTGQIELANCQGSIFHHNVFDESPDAPFPYAAVYGGRDVGSNSTFYRNIFKEPGTSVFIGFDAPFTLYYNNTFYGKKMELRGPDGQGGRFLNNLISDGRGINLPNMMMKGNRTYRDGDFVSPSGRDFRLRPGAAGIDTGVVIPGITDGFAGKRPDSGALEQGQKMWSFGYQRKQNPRPSYDWKPAPFANRVINPEFFNRIAAWERSGGADAYFANHWNMRQTANFSRFGDFSCRIPPGGEIKQTVTGLKKNTWYKAAASVKMVGPRTDFERSSKREGSFTKVKARGEDGLSGWETGEWVALPEIDFSVGQYNRMSLRYANAEPDFRVEVRLGSTSGRLLAAFSPSVFGRDHHHRETAGIPEIKGKQTLYVIARSNGGRTSLEDIYLFASEIETDDRLTLGIRNIGEGEVGENIEMKLGDEEYRVRYLTEPFYFKTRDRTSAEIYARNDGRSIGFIDGLSITDVDAPPVISSRNRPVSASERAGTPLAGATDGSIFSGGEARTADRGNSWLQVDLQSNRKREAIYITGPLGGSNALSKIRVDLYTADPATGANPVWTSDFFKRGSLGLGKTLVIGRGSRENRGTKALTETPFRFVRVTKTGNGGVLAIREIQVIDDVSGSRTQQTGYSRQSNTFGSRVADQAVDGNPATFSQTLSEGVRSYWEHIFVKPRPIGQIDITNTPKAPANQLSNFTVTVHDWVGEKTLWKRDYFTSGGVGAGQTFSIPGDAVSDPIDGISRPLASILTGRVRIQLRDRNNRGNNTLALGEVNIHLASERPSRKNLAAGGLASVSRVSGRTAPASALNNNDITPFNDEKTVALITKSSNGSSAFGQIDLLQPTSLDTIVVVPRAESVGNRNVTVSLLGVDKKTVLWEQVFYKNSGLLKFPVTLYIGKKTKDKNGRELSSVRGARLVRVSHPQQLQLSEIQAWRYGDQDAEVDLNAREYDYDFGPEGQAVQPGFTSVTPFIKGRIRWDRQVQAFSHSNTRANANNRDFCYHRGPANLTHRLRNGTWKVKLNMGDAGRAQSGMRVFAEGEFIKQVDAKKDQYPLVEFNTFIADETLSLLLSNKSAGGAWVLNRLSLARLNNDNRPEADDLVAATGTGRSKALTMRGRDKDGQTLKFQLRRKPLSGRVTISGNRATYTPRAGFKGRDFFTYVADDGFVTSREAVFTVFVNDSGTVPGSNDGGNPGGGGGGGNPGGAGGIVTSTGSFDNRTEYRWDFGPKDAPLQSGLRRFNPETRSGFFRWTRTPSRFGGAIHNGGELNDNYRRSIIYGFGVGRLSHRVRNGRWEVTVNFADFRTQNNMVVKAEGVTRASNVDVPGKRFNTTRFTVDITDGTLDLEFDDSDSTKIFTVAGLSLRRIGDVPSSAQTRFRFDFGTSDSPALGGWTRVTPDTRSGSFRWLEGGLESRDRGPNFPGNDDVRRDFIFAFAPKRFRVDVANGTWRVGVIFGDMRGSHDNYTANVEGVQFPTVTTNAATRRVEHVRDVVVRDGTLTTEFKDLGGSDPTWTVMGMYMDKR